VKNIQKKIKKELAEDAIPHLDFSKTSLSSGEINESITTVSLNIIKTRDLLKETFDEYIITLISFDKIKNKIKFLKSKNDESYNDCSPVFSKKFKIISNIERSINNDNDYEEDVEVDSFSNKISKISKKNGKRSKLVSTATMQDNLISADLRENSAEEKFLDYNANEKDGKSESEILRKNENEIITLSKISTGNKNKNSINKLQKGIEDDYEISVNTECNNSFSNNNYFKNQDILHQINKTKPQLNENVQGKNQKLCNDLNKNYNNNQHLNKSFYENYSLSGKDNSFNNYSNKRRNNHSENSRLINLNNSFNNKNNEIHDSNLDINSLYLDSKQFEEYNMDRSNENQFIGKKTGNSENYNYGNQNYYLNNSQIRDYLNKSEEEFKKNFPMKFYRHFLTENQYQISQNNNEFTNKTNKNRNASSLISPEYCNNSKNVYDEMNFYKNQKDSEAIYNFDKNNFSGISNDFIASDMTSNRRRTKNKSCDYAAFEKNTFLNNLDSSYMYNDLENKTINSHLDISARENYNNKNIETKSETSYNNGENMFKGLDYSYCHKSPLKKRSSNNAIINTGNKIHKMCYFEKQSNHSLLNTKKFTPKEIESLRTEKSLNNINNSKINKTDIEFNIESDPYSRKHNEQMRHRLKLNDFSNNIPIESNPNIHIENFNNSKTLKDESNFHQNSRNLKLNYSANPQTWYFDHFKNSTLKSNKSLILNNEDERMKFSDDSSIDKNIYKRKHISNNPAKSFAKTNKNSEMKNFHYSNCENDIENQTQINYFHDKNFNKAFDNNIIVHPKLSFGKFIDSDKEKFQRKQDNKIEINRKNKIIINQINEYKNDVDKGNKYTQSFRDEDNYNYNQENISPNTNFFKESKIN